jgi:uncharacterized protein YndB with AHSA1/START domain
MEVTREIVLQEEPAEVWEALTEPKQLEQWFATEVELDARPGGIGVFRWGNGEERRAVVQDVDPERKLALRFDDDGAVEIALEPIPDGTRVVVTESAPSFAPALGLRALASAWATA